MRLQHYNAAARGGTGNARAASIQAQCERGRRRKPRSGLDGRFRSALIPCYSRGLALARSSTSIGSSWSACARDSSNWSRPFASLPASHTASMSSMRSNFSSWLNISSPPSLNDRVAQHRSRSMRRDISPPAIPCAYRPQAARERPSRCGPRHRDPAAAHRPRRDVATNPRERPCSRRRAASHARKPRRPWPIPCRTPPPLRSETRPGAPWTRRVARRQAARKGRDTFSGSSPHALRARTTRKTAVGIHLFPRPTSLPPLPARPRCMRLARRKARHRGGPQSLRSKT